MSASSMPLVHLELHTPDLGGARGFYEQVCGWRTHRIDTPWGSYVEVRPRREVGGGIVECPTQRPVWLPYVRVGDVGDAVEHARTLGARVLLDPREGPSGWRSVVTTPAGGELAFWQPKQ